jgi:hypothetical protein
MYGMKDYLLVSFVQIQSSRNVFEGSVAAITSTASVCSVTDCVVLDGVGSVYADRVGVRQDDVRAGCVSAEVVVVAIQA